MKKNGMNVADQHWYVLRKAFFVMKLTLLILLITTFGLMAGESYSQETRITLNLKNVLIKDVLLRIENSSEYFFIYNNQLVDVDRKVSINVDNQKISDVLRDIFQDQNVDFQVTDRKIVLAPHATESQQQKSVSGKVSDSAGGPLPGVSVVIKGTTMGTITDGDGKYSMKNIPANATLVFSFVGMKMQEIVVGSQKTINVLLQDESIGLDEVVAIGYGTQKKVNLTGAMSNVNFENNAISSRPLTNVSSALSGMSSGLSIRQGDGSPSSNGATIKIRGIGSLNSSQNPLVIVDGQPMDINIINPNDVASISILKDAASSAIYGSRASNGVILITTKTGGYKDKISFNYTGSIGMAEPTKLIDLLSNTADHMSLVNQIQTNSGLSTLFTQTQIDEWREKSKTDVLYPNTGWWDAILKSNTIQNHNFSARGENDKVSFFSSLGYLNNNGIIDNTGYKKFNFRNNLTYKVNDWLTIGNNISALFGNAEPASTDAIFQYFEATTPGLLPKYDGKYGGSMTGSETSANNAVATIENSLGEKKTQEYTGKLFATIKPIKGLEINGSFFIDAYNYNTWLFSKPVEKWNFQTSTVVTAALSTPALSNSCIRSQRQTFDFFGSYVKSLGHHNFKILAGFNQEYYKYETFSSSKTGLMSYDVLVLDAASTLSTSSGNSTDYAMRSFFGRLNYDYQNKYLFEANLRYDGSSRFSKENRWGAFPSFSVGWRVSEESFWEMLKNTVNYLKLRGSWGQLGNNGIGNYDWQSVYKAYNYSFNGTIAQGVAPQAIANRDISWEITDVLNIGTDFRLFDKVSISADYYNKLTHGILATIPIPYVNGGLTAPRVNSAKVRNSGFEAEIKYETEIGNLSISASLNGSFNKNKIEKYKGASYIESRGNGTAWTEGKPMGIYYVREVDHIVQDKTEIDQLTADGWTFKPSTPGAGDFLYKDNDNNKIIDDNDRKLKGNPIPLVNYGGTLTLGYKGFDLYVLFNGVAGWDQYYKSTYNSLNHFVNGYLFPIEYLNSWTVNNPSTTIPKLYSNNTKNDQICDFYLHNADYLRIKTLQLGYTIPQQITERAKIGSVRLYINLENYFTFTSFPGMDPENDGSYYTSTITYPLMKTISLGMNINL